MAHLVKEGILSLKWIPRMEIVRYSRRVNVQRPRAPHYERAKYLALLEPMFEKNPEIYQPPSVKCKKNFELNFYKNRPDNPLEKIIARELFEKFESTKLVCFVHTNPISGDDEFQARKFLKKENMDIERHSKHTLKLAFLNTRYEAIIPLFVSHSAIIFSDEDNVHGLLKALKKIPQYVLLAGILDNKLLSVTQLKKYSEIKDLTTARAQLVGVLNSCAQRTVSQLMAHPQRLIYQLQHLASSDSEKS